MTAALLTVLAVFGVIAVCVSVVRWSQSTFERGLTHGVRFLGGSDNDVDRCIEWYRRQ